MNPVKQGGSNSVTVRTDVAEFKRLFEKSSQLEPKLKTALRRNIRQAAQVAVAHAAAEVLGPYGTVSSNPRHTGLRAGIAKGIKVKVMTGNRAGVTIIASAASLPVEQKSMVLAWEAKNGWRHPVFGTEAQAMSRRGHGRGWGWVLQKGNPFFRTVIFGHRDAIRAAVENAMAEAAASLKGT
jgi:hypothetical protein